MEDTWIHELKDAKTFYSVVTANELLDHLQKRCRGLHTLDIFDPQLQMFTYYAETIGISKYVNMLEDAQTGPEKGNASQSPRHQRDPRHNRHKDPPSNQHHPI